MLLCSARRIRKKFRVNSNCISLCAVVSVRASLAQAHSFVAVCIPQVPMPPPGLARQLLHGFRDDVADREPAGAAHPTPEFFLVQGHYKRSLGLASRLTTDPVGGSKSNTQTP